MRLNSSSVISIEKADVYSLGDPVNRKGRVFSRQGTISIESDRFVSLSFLSLAEKGLY